MPEITRVSGHRGEAYELLQSELQPLGMFVQDQPHVRRSPPRARRSPAKPSFEPLAARANDLTDCSHRLDSRSQVSKHAQEGTSLQDHTLLEHSGFGPFCNPVVCGTPGFDGIGSSLLHWVHCQQKSGLEWFQKRLAAMETYQNMYHAGSLSAGICVTCSFTQTDMLFNGLHFATSQGGDGASGGLSDVSDVAELFVPRPPGYYFPKISFTAKGKAVNLVVGAGINMQFVEDEKRKGGAKMSTICVQLAAALNWPGAQLTGPGAGCDAVAAGTSRPDGRHWPPALHGVACRLD